MLASLERIIGHLRVLAVSLLAWAITLAILMALAASWYYFGFWRTFVGGMLLALSIRMVVLSKALEELEGKLMKGPPTLHTIEARYLKAGMFLDGSVLLTGVNVLRRDGVVMALPKGPGVDSPFFFDPDLEVEVTDRPLELYAGGKEKIAEAMSRRFRREEAVRAEKRKAKYGKPQN